VIPLRRGRRRALPALALLLASAACGDGGEEPVERPEFSADRAWSFLGQQMAFGPRYPGHRGHDRQARWLPEQLGIRADTVLVQAFTHRAADGQTLKLTNFFARWKPEAAERILLVAHWDTRRRAERSVDPVDRRRPVPGANDGASGVAVLMELAEVMRQQAPPVGVDILLADGDDYGPGEDDLFLGTRHFAANLPVPGYRPRWAVVLSMAGDRDARFPQEARSRTHDAALVERIWGLAAGLGYDSVFTPTPHPAVAEAHARLAEAGIPAVLIVDPEYGAGNQLWHTVDDGIASVSQETLALVGNVVAELVYRGFPQSPASSETKEEK
jgi:peptidase M28-like protein